jgi:hypothetical protein
MNFEKIYREIKTCPWCLNKPTLTITPYPNKVTFDVRLGCRNMKNCLFNPHQELTCSLDELDSCIVEIIDNWNGRTENAVQPPQITITADTESNWTLSEFSKTSEEANSDENICDAGCIWCKYHFLDDDDYLWCRGYDERTESAIKKCRREDFIDETDENRCADCKHYWYCAGEECCNLDELSFPEPCNKFEQEDSE